MTEKKRIPLVINELMKHYNFKKESDFAKFLGISPQNLSNWRSRGSMNLGLILTKCVDIDLNWILTGEGDMVRTDVANLPLNKKEIPLNKKAKYTEAENIGELVGANEENIEYKSGNQFINIGNGMMQMIIPRVQTYAYAGYLSGYADPEFLEELPKFSIIVDKYHTGTYRSFDVRGDSMDDNSKQSISNGEIAVGRKIHKQYWNSKLHLFQWQNYVIVHESGIIIKRITHHDVENGIITAISLNPDKTNYPDLSINLSECYELYNIVQIVRSSF